MILDERMVNGRKWYRAMARGWSSGWCSSGHQAVVRVEEWHACREVSEAPYGQASYAQMEATLELVIENRPRDGGVMQHDLERALDRGIDSDEWITATAHVVYWLRDERVSGVTSARMRKTVV